MRQRAHRWGRVAAALALGGAGRVEAQPALAAFDPFAVTDSNGTGGATGVPIASLYELRVGRVARVPIRVYESGGEVLVPRDAVARATGVGTLVIGSAHTRTIDGVAYVPVGEMARALRVQATVDDDEAAVTILDPDSLPVARRAARVAARGWMSAEAPFVPVDYAAPAARAFLSGLAVDYAVTHERVAPAPPVSYAANVMAGVGGGSLVTRWSGAARVPGVAARRLSFDEVAWSRLVTGNRGMTQLRLGDGIPDGPDARPMRGAFVTNAPLARAMTVDVVSLDGVLPPGWGVDVYRDGALVAYDTVGAAGHYTLELPVRYGENPFRVVASGPFGETRTFTHTYRALPLMIPTGTWEYAASAGACATPGCRWAALGELRYGASPRLAFRGGVTYAARDTDPSAVGRRTVPYVTMTAVPYDGFVVELERVSQRVGRAGVWIDPVPGFSLAAEYTGHDSLAPGQRGGGEWSVVARSVRRGWWPALDAQSVGRMDVGGARSVSSRVAVAVPAGAVTLWPRVRVARSTIDGVVTGAGEDGTFVGTDATLVPAAWGLPQLSAWWVRASIENAVVGAHGVSRGELSVMRAGVARARVEGGMRWQRGIPGVALTLSVVADFAALRSRNVVSAPSRNGDRAEAARRETHAVSGSLRWEHGALFASPEPSLDRAGVSGVVFLDANANGRRDAGERPVAGVVVNVDGLVTRSGADGRYQAWGSRPGGEVRVWVDTTTLASPWWTPAFNVSSVTVRQNQTAALDVPVVAGGLVEGSVVVTDSTGMHPIAGGVPVTLTHVATGVRRTVQSFSDGTFYQLGVRPGTYEVSIDPDIAARLGYGAAMTRITVRGERATRSVQVRLRPREQGEDRVPR